MTNLNSALLGWRIKEVGWPSEPAQFEWLDSTPLAVTPGDGISWRLIEFSLPERSLTQFKKVWPEGSAGSGGGADAYDFSNAATDTSTWGGTLQPALADGWPAISGPHYLASGPWRKAGGGYPQNSDRPVRAYHLKKFQSGSLWIYEGYVVVLPSMDRYVYQYSSNTLQSTIGIDILQTDGTTDSFSRSVAGSTPHTLSEMRVAFDALRDDINAGTGATATTSQDAGSVYLDIGQETQGLGMGVPSSVVGMNSTSLPGGSISSGSLDVDWSGNEFETIDVIS